MVINTCWGNFLVCLHYFFLGCLWKTFLSTSLLQDLLPPNFCPKILTEETLQQKWKIITEENLSNSHFSCMKYRTYSDISWFRYFIQHRNSGFATNCLVVKFLVLRVLWSLDTPLPRTCHCKHLEQCSALGVWSAPNLVVFPWRSLFVDELFGITWSLGVGLAKILDPCMCEVCWEFFNCYLYDIGWDGGLFCLCGLPFPPPYCSVWNNTWSFLGPLRIEIGNFEMSPKHSTRCV